MDRYHESATVVSEDAAQRLVDEHKARVWRNPRSGITRFYLSVDALEDLIGLDVEFYKSGNVRRCSYIDADGEEMRIPVERAAVFAAAYSNAFTMRALRRYHEWVNS